MENFGTPQEARAHAERQLFGMTEQEIIDDINRMIWPNPKNYVLSLLSDAQEMMSFKGTEKDNRRRINVCKKVIDIMFEDKASGRKSGMIDYAILDEEE